MKDIRHHRTTESPCPVCNRLLDAATSVSIPPSEPAEGDVSICFYCTAYLIYDAKLQLNELHPDLFRQLPQEHKNVLISMRNVIRNRKGTPSC